MMARVLSPPARSMVRFRIVGSGFDTPNVSAPQIARNRGRSLSASSSRSDSHSSLLVQTARRLNRYEFLITFAPLPVEGGTGSPVNPVAIF